MYYLKILLYYASMDVSSSNFNISFGVRCKEIELARNACRIISAISGTKKYVMLQDSSHIKDNMKVYVSFQEDLWERFRYGQTKFSSKEETKIYNILNSGYNLQKRIETFRKNIDKSNEQAKLILEQVLKKHEGNCAEMSSCVQIILSLNGIKNTCVASLSSDTADLDHEICLFNRDGSEFDGKINNNNTIIVDPWLGIVDFANTALKTIKNCYGKYFNLSSEDRLNLTDIRILKPPKCNSNEYEVHK